MKFHNSQFWAGLAVLLFCCLASEGRAAPQHSLTGFSLKTEKAETGNEEVNLEEKVISSQTASSKEAEQETYYPLPAAAEEETFSVPPPLVYQGLFPCQACHRRDTRGVSSQLEKGDSFLGKYIRTPDPKPRTLIKMHRNIQLKHASWHWCLNCHDQDERNYLHLITGEKIPFEKSYRLCGQCHGIIYRDWKIGIHGRRVGNWNGKKLYLLCSHCHDPHRPRFQKLPAEDPPKKPNFARWDVADGETEASE